MTYTKHGHHIQGTEETHPYPPKMRCGGPGLCRNCSSEAATYVEAITTPSTNSLHEDLRHVFNKHSVENGANIPDSILATYTIDCLKALNTAVRRRDSFFGISVFPGSGALQTSVEEPPALDPTCVAAWPECKDGMYDPRCCRFPKACSPILETVGVVVIEEAAEGTEE